MLRHLLERTSGSLWHDLCCTVESLIIRGNFSGKTPNAALVFRPRAKILHLDIHRQMCVNWKGGGAISAGGAWGGYSRSVQGI